MKISLAQPATESSACAMLTSSLNVRMMTAISTITAVQALSYSLFHVLYVLKRAHGQSALLLP